MAFVKRILSMKFSLGEGSFGESGANQTEVTGLRMSAKIVKAGGNAMSRAQLQIFGLTLDKMNTLSTLGLVPTLTRKNTVVVTAGNDSGDMATVFTGTIQNAWFAGDAAPDVPFNVEAFAGLLESVQPVAASSYKGSTDVATIMSSLADKMKLKFENNGVSQKIANPYFNGAGRQQAQQVAEAAGINMIIDNGVLAIWPTSGMRSTQKVLISPSTGLIKYPLYTSHGIQFDVEFNPNIAFGGQIEMQSSLKPACGTWNVYSLIHDLQSEVPKGLWQSQVLAARPGLVVVK